MFKILSRKCVHTLLDDYNIVFTENIQNTNSKYIINNLCRNDGTSYILCENKVSYMSLEYGNKLSFAANSYERMFNKALMCIDNMYYRKHFSWFNYRNEILDLKYPSLILSFTLPIDISNNEFLSIRNSLLSIYDTRADYNEKVFKIKPLSIIDRVDVLNKKFIMRLISNSIGREVDINLYDI